MQRIIYFLIRNKDFILFLSLFTISLSININYNEYNKSKFFNSSNSLFSSLEVWEGHFNGIQRANQAIKEEIIFVIILILNIVSF